MTKYNPLISIIIPCYNQAIYLPETIASVLGQSYKNWECIIINDGSTDNTATVAKTLAQGDSRISVINQANKGLSGARNSGLKTANGTFFQFLDADDMLEFDKFRVQVEFLQKNPEIDIVFGDARYFNTENPQLRDYGFYESMNKGPWIQTLWDSPGKQIEKFLQKNQFPVNCPLVKRKVFELIGNWNENLDALEDWEFWFRCISANITISFNNTQGSLALIRMHSESMTRDNLRINKSLFKIRVEIGHFIKDPKLRLINFKLGLEELKILDPSDFYTQLFNLAHNNRTFYIYLYTIYFIFFKKSITIYKKITPWPIQKLISKFL